MPDRHRCYFLQIQQTTYLSFICFRRVLILLTYFVCVLYCLLCVVKKILFQLFFYVLLGLHSESCFSYSPYGVMIYEIGSNSKRWIKKDELGYMDSSKGHNRKGRSSAFSYQEGIFLQVIKEPFSCMTFFVLLVYLQVLFLSFVW